MPWQPALGTQPLDPFDHQVAGQSSMLRYDKTTVCKPLIAREHFLYKTLPQELIEFTPEYRGEIEVQLIEEDGYIQLYGLCVGDDDDDASDEICPCTSIPGNHSHESLDVRPKVISKEASIKNRSTIRVLRSGSYEVSPSTDEVFYAVDSNPDHPHTHSLNPWSLKNHKRLLDKMRKSEHSRNKIRFILLKNVVADFRHPCILDLKIGSRLHGDDASNVKVASQSAKCRRTTSSTLGVRLCGMQVYQVESSAYHSIDKYHGRTLNNESFRDMLHNFLHNGTMFRSDLIQPIVLRLSQLIDCLEKLHSFRFYASSLLIIYDGDVRVTPGDQEAKLKASESVITVDMAPVEHIIEHSNSPKERCLSGDKQSDEHSHSYKELCHPHSSKEMCHSVEEHPCGYVSSSKESCQLTTQQPNEAYCDFCSVSFPQSLQSFTNSPDKQSQLISNILQPSSGNIVYEDQVTRFASADANVGHLFTPNTIPHHVTTTLNQPITELLQQHTVKNDVLKSGKHLYSSSQSIETEDTVYNHLVQREPVCVGLSTLGTEKTSVSLNNTSVQGSHHVGLSTLGTEKTSISINNTPVQGSHHVGSSTLGTEKTSVSLKNTSVQGSHHVGLSTVGTEKTPVSLNNTSVQGSHHCEPQTVQKVVLDSDSLSHIQPSSIYSVSPRPTHSPIDDFLHSVVLTRIQERLSHIVYGSISEDTLCQIQQDHNISLVDSEKSPKTQNRHFVDHHSESAQLSNSNESPDGRSFSQADPMTSLLRQSSNSSTSSVKVDVKMIDFAHTTHQGFTADKIKHAGPDTDYIFGLRNLMKLFQELQERD